MQIGSVVKTLMPVARLLGGLGPVLLFLAASANGMLEVHPSADTWIGLAAGRQIVQLGQVPTTDSFSFTFAGQPWFNQNWGSHWIQYSAFAAFGPDAVIYLNWAFVLATFLLVVLACYWRSGHWLGSLLAASLVAFGARDFLSARPATTGFLCMAALAALLAALEGQGVKRRWWPIAALLPLLLVWGAVHGSFTFGYAVVGLYVAHSLLARRIGSVPSAIDTRQAIGIAAATIAALVLTIVLGPFGLANFIHPEKIATSNVFRAVAEWKPALEPGGFPRMWRFWWVCGAAVLSLVTARLIMRRGATGPATPSIASAGSLPATRVPRVTLFDQAVLLIGVGMTLWARRFAPIALIFGSVVVLARVVELLRGADEGTRRRLATLLVLLSWPAAAVLLWITVSQVRSDLVDRYAEGPAYNLLERVTRYDESPYDAIGYLRDNELRVNLFMDWPQAGIAMLDAPLVRVFIDGRAQQLYDERIYKTYVKLVSSKTSASEARERLEAPDMTQVDGFLLRPGMAPGLMLALRGSPDWRLVYSSPRSQLFLRSGSEALRRVQMLVREGREQRVDDASGWLIRGDLLAGMDPPQVEAALLAYEQSAQRDFKTASKAFAGAWTLLDRLGRYEDARTFMRRQHLVLEQSPTVASEKERRVLRRELETWERLADRKLAASSIGRAAVESRTIE